MARYIDAEPMLREAIEERKFVFAMEDAKRNEIIVRTVYKDLYEFIEAQPTADVEEVKHGKWEKLKYLGNCINPCQHTCGVCGKSYFDDNHNNYPFCPLCGAKMDGGKQE